MSNFPTIRLSTDRVRQLKEMAAGMDMATMSKVVGELLKLAREHGLVKHGIPSIKINAFPDGVSIKFEESDYQGFTFSEIEALVRDIRAYTGGASKTKKRKAANLGYLLSGKGRGVSIAVPASSETPKLFSHDLADEFADLLERAVAEVTPRQLALDEDRAPDHGETPSLIVQYIDKLDAVEFHERHERFLSGEAPIIDTGDLSLGPSDKIIKAREDAILDDLNACFTTGNSGSIPELQPKGIIWSESDSAEVEKIYDEPSKPTPYERAFIALRAAESAVKGLSQESSEYYEAMSRLAVARRNFRTETDRAPDENWRTLRRTDVWRGGDGRKEYNQDRRKVRAKPNTDKATMAAMSEEERNAHTNAQKADSAWVKRKSAAGWSEEKIATALEDRRSKREQNIQVAFVDAYKGNPSFGTF